MYPGGSATSDWMRAWTSATNPARSRPVTFDWTETNRLPSSRETETGPESTATDASAESGTRAPVGVTTGSASTAAGLDRVPAANRTTRSNRRSPS